GGSAAVGAKVEVGQSKASLLETRLLLTGIEVANPKSPMKNLVEADRLDIDFSTTALLRKKLVAEYGILSGLAFATDREVSGALAQEPESDQPPSWLTQKSGKLTGAWFDNLAERFEGDLRGELKSVQLAEQLAAKWPAKYQQLEANAKAIKADAKRLEDEWKAAKKNPLRHADFLARGPQETTNLRRALRDVQPEMPARPDHLNVDQHAVRAPRLHDEALIRQYAQLDDIDPQALTDYLLGEQTTGPLNETIGWL